MTGPASASAPRAAAPSFSTMSWCRRRISCPAIAAMRRPTADGAIFQIIQAAVDTGIAKAAIEDTVAFVRTKSRPWIDSGQDRASDDPYTIAGHRRPDAAAACDRGTARSRGGRRWTWLWPTPRRRRSRRRSLPRPRRRSSRPSSRSMPPASCSNSRGRARPWRSRHWTGIGRNARTHTLHDPVRWKYAILGNHALNGVNPPLHAWS